MLRWHRRNANSSCYAQFLPLKLPKTVLLRTAAHDFLPNLRVTHNIFFPLKQGPATALCHLKVGGAFHERLVKRTKNGPNPKTFRVGPYTENFSLRQVFCRTILGRADPHLKTAKQNKIDIQSLH